MIDYGTQQSTVKPLELELTETKVFVSSNITPVAEHGTEEQPGFTGYEFGLVEYDKDEYIRLQAEKGEEQAETILMLTACLLEMSEYVYA